MITTDWRDNQGPVFAHPTYAIGDVHGQDAALARLLDHLDGLPAASGPREIIFLGDLIDRGPGSIAAVRLAWQARARFAQHTILPGNHELMMLGGLDGIAWLRDLWLRNGGMACLREVDPWEACDIAGALALLRAALPDGYLALMREGPTHLVRADTLFVHAGLHPHQDPAAFLDADRFGNPDENHWAWIRQPFLGWEKGWSRQGFALVVHGHSPATLRPIQDAIQADELLDCTEGFRCICLDAGAARLPQVAAVEFDGARHRLHIAEAPETNPFATAAG